MLPPTNYAQNYASIIGKALLGTDYVGTKFRRNLRRVSIFCVDLTWNDPHTSGMMSSASDPIPTPCRSIATHTHLHTYQWCRPS